MSNSVCKLETGSRQDKTQFTPHFETGRNCKKTKHVQFRNFLSPTVLTCFQFSSHRRYGQDKAVLCCPCRRCEIGIGLKVTESRKGFQCDLQGASSFQVKRSKVKVTVSSHCCLLRVASVLLTRGWNCIKMLKFGTQVADIVCLRD